MTEQEQHDFNASHEARLRGSTLLASASIEAVLMRIVYFSNAAQWDVPEKSESLKIKRLTFGCKIARAKELISQHHSDLLDKYSDLFKSLEVFCDIRNKLAHCAILWLDVNCEKLQIFDVVEFPNKFQFYVPEEYLYDELSGLISSQFIKISAPLVELQNIVESRLRQNHQSLYYELSLVLGSGL